MVVQVGQELENTFRRVGQLSRLLSMGAIDRR